MKYKLLVFDADDTLFDFGYAERLAFKQVIHSQIDGSDFEKYFETYKAVNKKVWEEREQGLISFDKLKVERFRRFFNIADIRINPEKAGHDYLINLSHINKLLPDAYRVVEELSKDYLIAILTNGLTLVQKPRLMNSEIIKFINAHVISEEVGYSKPQPEIFNVICEKNNFFDKSKILIIGDNYSSDIIGGIAFGIDTCWLSSENSPNNHIENFIAPTYRISNLIEILDILSH